MKLKSLAMDADGKRVPFDFDGDHRIVYPEPERKFDPQVSIDPGGIPVQILTKKVTTWSTRHEFAFRLYSSC